jgi:hypothetical protein
MIAHITVVAVYRVIPDKIRARDTQRVCCEFSCSAKGVMLGVGLSVPITRDRAGSEFMERLSFAWL